MKNYFKSLFAIIAFSALIACSNTSKQEDAAKKNQQVETVNSSDGDDVFLLYEIMAEVNDSLQPSGKASLYLSDNAIRSEITMLINGREMNMVMLANTDEPNKTILLSAETKTYTKMDLGEISDNATMKKMKDMQKDSLTILDEEKINGYNCTKISIVTTLNTSSALAATIGGNGRSVTQYWMTKDIPGYEKTQQIFESQPKILNGKNAEIYQYGIPVKQVTTEEGKVTMIMELKTAEQQDIKASKFEIPKGYNEA